MAAGLIVESLALGRRGFALGHLPITNLFEYLGLLSWATAIFYFVAMVKFRRPEFETAIAWIVFMLVAAASLLPKEPSAQLVPALRSIWLPIHVTLAAAGEAAFAVAFGASLLFLLKRAVPMHSRLGRRLPDWVLIDQFEYKAISAGYPLFTVGALFAGAIWAHQAWGSFWSWDPKEVGALIIWLVYTIYLHARWIRGWRGMPTVLLSLLGFICVLATIFATLVLGGLHGYN